MEARPAGAGLHPETAPVIPMIGFAARAESELGAGRESGTGEIMEV